MQYGFMKNAVRFVTMPLEESPMLYYTEVGLDHLEVPNESALCIYISGCPNHCINCHYPQLRLADYGSVLMYHFTKIIDLYSFAATCTVFLGEGSSKQQPPLEKTQLNSARRCRLDVQTSV